MTNVDIKKSDLFQLFENNNRSIDSFLIAEVCKLIECESNIKLQYKISESLQDEIKKKLTLLSTTWKRLNSEDRDLFRNSIRNQYYRIILKPYDMLPGKLGDQYEAFKSRLDLITKENHILENENKILKSQIKLLKDQLSQKDDEIELLKQKLEFAETKSSFEKPKLFKLEEFEVPAKKLKLEEKPLVPVVNNNNNNDDVKLISPPIKLMSPPIPKLTTTTTTTTTTPTTTTTSTIQNLTKLLNASSFQPQSTTIQLKLPDLNNSQNGQVILKTGDTTGTKKLNDTLNPSSEKKLPEVKKINNLLELQNGGIIIQQQPQQQQQQQQNQQTILNTQNGIIIQQSKPNVTNGGFIIQQQSNQQNGGIILQQQNSNQQNGGIILQQQNSNQQNGGIILRQQNSNQQKQNLVVIQTPTQQQLPNGQKTNLIVMQAPNQFNAQNLLTLQNALQQQQQQNKQNLTILKTPTTPQGKQTQGLIVLGQLPPQLQSQLQNKSQQQQQTPQKPGVQQTPPKPGVQQTPPKSGVQQTPPKPNNQQSQKPMTGGQTKESPNKPNVLQNTHQTPKLALPPVEGKKKINQIIETDDKKLDIATLNKITKFKHVKRKSYLDCSKRQQHRLKAQLKDMLTTYISGYLTALGLCFHEVIIYPLELDESDFKLDIREFYDCGDKSQPEVNKLLYHKDKFSISDRAYNALKSKCNLDIPSLYIIKNRRAEIDEMFQLFDNPLGVYVSVKAKLIKRTEAFFERKYGLCDPEEFDPAEFNDDILHVRLAADGTNIGRNLKMLNITFIMLNEGPRSRTANGNYTLGIYEISNENYENIVICFKELIEEISNLNEITIGKKKIKLIYYYAGDWKMLAHCLGIQSANSKYPCVWCKCNKEDFTDKSLEWSISDPSKGARSHEDLIKMVQLPNNSKTIKYGYDRLPIFKDIIPINRYMIDMLHLFLRISDTLLNLLVKDCTLVDNFESWNISRFNVAEYKHLNAFQQFLNEKCGVNFKFLWLSDSKKLTWRDLVGPEKIRLFENFDLKMILPEHDKFDLVSKLWNEFYSIIKAVKLVEITHDELKKKTEEWLDLFLQIYNKTTVTPYIHAFVTHLHEFVYLYKDINAFNLQGLERLNELSTGQYFKGTNKRDSAMHQMLKKRNRMEYLRLYVDDTDMN